MTRTHPAARPAPAPPAAPVPAAPPGGRVLLVCTGNVCRSPMAAALLVAALEAAPAAETVEVGSVGLLWEGRPAEPEAVHALAARGLDLSGHRSRRLSPPLVERADVVLGMEPRHVREVVAACPAAWPRAFTLREAVVRGEAAGARRAGEALAGWLTRLGEGRTRRDLLGDGPELALADPYRQPAEVFERTAADLDRLVRRFARLAWPTAAAPEAAAAVTEGAGPAERAGAARRSA